MSEVTSKYHLISRRSSGQPHNMTTAFSHMKPLKVEESWVISGHITRTIKPHS